MRVLITFLLIIETTLCFSQNPTITFGGLKDSIVTKSQLLQNDGIIISNDTSSYISCLKAVDFTFKILKINGDTIEIKTNNCAKKVNERKEERAMKRFNKGKTVKYFSKRSRCQGVDRFNQAQKKAIRKMKSGESILIDTVKTKASGCYCLNRWWAVGLKYTLE